MPGGNLCDPGCGWADAADGVFAIREDLGGAAALAEGIRRVHATGRKIQLYVSGDIAHSGSRLFNASWPASKWAQWWEASGPHQSNHPADGPAFHEHASYMCHAFEAWQTAVAEAVARTARLSGCDGFRLDGLGNFHHAPCYNTAHNHSNPYSNQV